ncbi:MAG: PAS domain-containing protein, partial [Mariprofundaceae bacterium]|nr:PAS domain-containing protein [Mariprofundaceae bacterium]
MFEVDGTQFAASYEAFLETIHPDDRDRVDAAFTRHLEGNEPYDVVHRLLMRDGGIKYVHERCETERDADGTPLRCIGTVQDVTERLLADQLLERSRERYQALVDNLTQNVFIKDINSVYLSCNKTYARMLDLNPEDLIGHRDEEFFPADLVEKYQADDQRVMRDGKKIEMDEGYFVHGERRTVHTVKVPVKDEQGEVYGVLGIFWDVTEERYQREKMEHVQRLESLGVLAGGIAHDFNNLLTAIMGHAALARMKCSPMDDTQQSLRAIEDTSRKAAELCKQMLAYAGKGKFVVQPVDLSALVEEMARLLEVSIEKSTLLRYDLAPNLPAVEADLAQMQQVIMNLVINANESIDGRSGLIVLATGAMQADADYLHSVYVEEEALEPGTYVWLEVTDTGCGMNDETKMRLFEPFYTTKFTGRGLGMSAILGIVRGHNGAIKVYSELNKGTTIKVLLPASGALAAPLDIPQGVDDAGRHAAGGLVLIVDDEETIRTVAAMMLEAAGYRTLQAGDGLEGVEMLKAHRDEVDCVLLDMTMPRMGGEEAFTEMRRINPDVRVLLSSGYNEQTATQRFTGKGLAGFVQKPYTPELLLNALGDVLSPSQGGS